jgi:hypothetical protein
MPCGILHPNRTPKKVWNIVLALLLLYTATVMPYRMAFIDSELWDDWFWVELCIDILFFIDVLINCNSAYLDNEGVLITSRRRILTNYAQGWLVLDLVACFPFSFVDSSGNDQ